MAAVIVSGALANKPFNGGEAWVRLSWFDIHGLLPALGTWRENFQALCQTLDYFDVIQVTEHQTPRPGDHWGEEIDFPVENWQDQVANDETRLGYWDWVENHE